MLGLISEFRRRKKLQERGNVYKNPTSAETVRSPGTRQTLWSEGVVGARVDTRPSLALALSAAPQTKNSIDWGDV